jgi:hypothetical protein
MKNDFNIHEISIIAKLEWSNIQQYKAWMTISQKIDVLNWSVPENLTIDLRAYIKQAKIIMFAEIENIINQLFNKLKIYI